MTAYSGNTANWMSQLSDEILMSSLTIPGTHDSAAFTYNVPFITTQRLNFQQQLDAGVRYFDMRCGLRANVLEMVHGPTYLGLSFETALKTMYEWLKINKSEALIVQLKKDRSDDNNSTVSFSQAVLNTLGKSSTFWRTTNTTPKLGELRGKIQLFRRFKNSALYMYGINVSGWQNNPTTPFTMRVGRDTRMTVQDHYRYIDPEPLDSLIEKKVSEIQELMSLASSNEDSTHWYVNFTSAVEFNWSYRFPPRTIAEGGRSGFKRVQGVNDTLSELFSQRKRYGIVAMDYPDSNEGLIIRLIMSNFPEQNEHTKWALLFLLLLLTVMVWHDKLAYLVAAWHT